MDVHFVLVRAVQLFLTHDNSPQNQLVKRGNISGLLRLSKNCPVQRHLSDAAAQPPAVADGSIFEQGLCLTLGPASCLG